MAKLVNAQVQGTCGEILNGSSTFSGTFIGVWCNGNTTVFGAVITSSTLVTPTKFIL